MITGLRKGSFGNSLVIKRQNYHNNVHTFLYVLTFVILIKLKNYNYRRLVKLLKKYFEVKLWNPRRLHLKIITNLQLMLYGKGWNLNQNGN